jgi:hypothetical protein
MANRYWVGGSGTWNPTSTTNWSTSSGGTGGASVPTGVDNVIFDQASTYTVNVLVGTVFCLDFTVSAGTLTINAGQFINIAGNMTLTSSTVMTSSPTFGPLLTGPNPNLTLTTNGANLTDCEFNISCTSSIGTYYLGSALTLSNTKTFTLTAGNLALNGYNLSTGKFSSSNANTRGIIFGSNYIDITNRQFYVTQGSQILMATMTGFTCSGTGGFRWETLVTDSTTYQFEIGSTAGGTAAGAPNVFFIGVGERIPNFTSGSWFNRLDLGNTTYGILNRTINVSSLILSPDSTSAAAASGIDVTAVGTGTITSYGKQIGSLTINHAGITTLGSNLQVTAGAGFAFLTLTNGTLNLNNFNLSVVQVTRSGVLAFTIAFGTGNIELPSSGTTGRTVISIANATSFSCTGTGGFVSDAGITKTYVFGTTAGSAANAPSLTITSGDQVQTLTTGSWFKNLDFGTTAFTLPATSLSLQGLTLSATGTYTGLTALMVGSGNLSGNGRSILSMTMNTAGITQTLQSAFTITGNIIFAQGTLVLNGFDLTVGTFGGSQTTARQIQFGSNNIILNTTTPATFALQMLIADNFTWTGTGGFVTDASITRTIAFGATTGGTLANAPNITLTGSGTSVITFQTASWFNSINFGTTSFTLPTATLNLNNLTLTSGVTFTNLTVNIVNTGASTITTNGNTTLGTLNISAVTGTVTLADSLTTVVTGSVTLTSGTLNLNNFNLATGIFQSNNSTTRSIQFGTGIITLQHTTAATLVLAMANLTGFTWTGTGRFACDASVTRTITVGTTGGTITNAPNLTLGSGVSVITFTTGSWFNTLNFGNSAFTVPATTLNCNNLVLNGPGIFSNLTVAMRGTGSVTSAGNGTLLALTINTVTGTTSLADALTLTTTGITTLTSGTFSLNGFDLTTGTFSSNNSNTRTLSLVNNVITLRTTTAAAVNLDMATMTGFSIVSTLGRFIVDTSVGRTFQVGSTAGGTSANAPSITFTTPSSNVPILTTGSWFNNFNTSLSSITFGSSAINVNTMNFSATSTYTSLGITLRGTTTFNTGGKSLASFGVNNGVGAGTVTLGANVTAGSFTLTSGTLDLSTFSVTATAGGTDGNIAGGTLLGSGTLACQQLSISGTFTHTTGTLGPSVALNINAGSVFTFSGGIINSVPTVTQSGGTFILSKAYALTTTGEYALTGGTLTLNGFDLTTGTFRNNASVSSHTVNFGSNYINLVTNVAAQTNINMSTTSGTSSFSGTGGFKADASITRTFSIGNTAGGAFTKAPNLFITGNGTAVLNFSTGSWFATLDFNTFGTTAFTVPTTTINVISLVLNSTGTFNLLTATFVGDVTRPGTLTSNSKQLAAVTLNSSNTVTIADAANTLGTFTFIAGTLNNASTITANAVNVTGTGTYSQGTLNVTTTFTISSGTFNYNGGTIALNQTTGSFVHTAGIFNVNTAFSIGTLTYTFTAGTINLNSVNLTVGTFSSAVSGLRTINFGANNIVLAHTTAAQTVLSMADATSFTYTATSGGFTTDTSVTRTFTFGTTGGSTTNAPNLSITSGASVPTFTDGSWFKVLKFTGTTCAPAMTASVLGINVSVLTLATGGTYTGFIPVFTRSQVWVPQFDKQLGGMGYNNADIFLLGGTQSFTSTSTFILTQGTLDLNGYNLTVGAFSSSNANTRAINFRSNSITLNHATTAITVLNMATATGFTYTGTPNFITDAAVTRTLVFGTTGGSVTNAPNLSLTGSGSSVVTLTTASWFNVLNFGTTAFNPGTTALNITNSLTLSFSGTYSTLTISHLGTGTLALASKTIAALTINIPSGTSTMSGSGTVTGATTLTAGTLNLANNSLVTGTFSSDNSNVRSIIFGNGTIHLNTNTAAQTCLAMATATNFTWTGTGGFTTNCFETRTFSFGSTAGGSIANAPNLSFSTGSSVMTVTSGSWFNVFTVGSPSTSFAAATINLRSFTASAANINSLTLNMVSDGIIDCQGGSTPAAVTVNCPGVFTTLQANLSIVTNGVLTLTAGTLNLNGFAIGAGILSSSGTLVRSITFGSGSYIQLGHTTAGTTVLNMADVTNFTFTGTSDIRANASITRTFTFGTTGGSITNSLNLNIASGAATPTFTNGSWFNTINFTGSTAGPAGTVNINNCILASGGTYTALGLTLRSGTLPTFNGKAIGPFEINNGANTTTLTAAVSCSTFIMTAGTIDFATFNLTCSSTATYTSGTMNNMGTITCTTFVVQGTLTLASGTITPSAGFTLTSGAFTLGSGGSLAAVPTVTHTSGTLTLGKAYALTTTGIYTLDAGTLNLGGFNLTTGTFSSTNSNTRSIIFGSNNIVLATTTAAATNLSMAVATGFTYTGTGGFVSDASVTRTYQFGITGGSITNAPNLSITSGASVPTFNDGSWFNILNFTGTTCTPAMTASVIGINVNTLTLATGGTYTGFIPVFNSTQTWTPQFDKQLGGMVINGAGITVTLGGVQTFVTNATLTLTQGTLNLNGHNLTVGIFSSNNSNIRSLIFGSSFMTILHFVAATTVLNMANATNFTSTVTTGGFVTNADITRTLTFGTTGGTATNSPNVLLTGSGTAVLTFTTGSWFNKLDFGSTNFNPGTLTLNLNSLTLSQNGFYNTLTANMVGTGAIVNQVTASIRILGTLIINSGGGTTTISGITGLNVLNSVTLTAGVIDLTNLGIQIEGAGGFISSNTNTRSIVFGTNYITFSAVASPGTLNMAIATGFTCSGTGGFSADCLGSSRTYTFGTTDGSAVSAPNLRFTGTSTNAPILTTGSWFKTLDFGSTASYALAATTINIAGNLTLSNSGTPPNFSNLTVTMVGTGTITANARPIAALNINSGTGTTTLAGGALVIGSTATTTLISGTLNLNGFALNTGTFSSNNSNPRSIIFGSTNILLTTSIAAVTNIDMANATNFTSTSTTGGFVTLDMSITRTFTFGTTGGSATNAPNLSITGGLAVPTFTDGSWFKTLNFTGNSSAPAMTATNIGIYVDTLTLASLGTYTGLIPVFTRTQTWTMQQSKQLLGIGFNLLNGTLTLEATQSYVAGTSKLFLYLGTINLASITLTIGNVITGSTGVFTNTGTISCATFTVNSGSTYQHTNGTLTISTSMSVSGTFIQSGGTVGSIATITLNAGGIISSVATITCTTFTANGGTILNGNISSSTFGVGASSNFTFNGGSIAGAITMTSGTFTYVSGLLTGVTSFTHTAGTLSLFNSPTLGATSTYTFSSGIININGYTLTTGIFSSSGVTVRDVNFGTGSIALAHTTAGTTVLNMPISSNFRTSGTGGFTSVMSVTRTFDCGSNSGGIAFAPNLRITSGASVPTFISTGTTSGTSSSFNILDFTGSTCAPVSSSVNAVVNVNSLILATGGTYTSFNPCLTTTQTWTPQFNKQLGGMAIFGSGITVTLGGTQTFTATGVFTLQQGILNLGGYNFTISTFISTTSNTRSIVFGSNTITTDGSNIIAIDMTNATTFSCTGTGGFVVNFISFNQTVTIGSGGVPTIAPNVRIGPSSLQTTLTSSSVFGSLTFDSSYTGTLLPSTSVLTVTSLTLSAAATYGPGLTIQQANGSGTITTNGKTLQGFAIASPGSTITLGSAVSVVAAGLTTLTQGTLILNGYNLTTGTFNTDNANTRSVSFGNNNIVLISSSSGGTALSAATVTGFSWTGNGGFITDSLLPKTYNFGATAGGTRTNAPNLTFINSGTSAPTFTTGSWFNTLNLSSAVNTGVIAATTINLNSLILSPNAYQHNITATMVGSGTITTNNMPLGALTINNTGITTLIGNLSMGLYTTSAATTTLTSGTLNLNNYTLTTGLFSSDNSNTRSIQFGSGNIIVNHTTSGTTVIAMATSSNFTCTGSGGFITNDLLARTYSVSSTAGSQSSAINLAFVATSNAIAPTISPTGIFNILDLGTTAFQIGAPSVIVSTLILSPNGSYTIFAPILSRTQTWTKQHNKILAGLGFSCIGGTLTLDGTQNFGASGGSFNLTAGTLDLGGYDLTIGLFNSNNSNTRAINFGSNNIILNSLSGGTVLGMGTATGFTWTGTGGFRTDVDTFLRALTFGTTGGTAVNAPNLTFTGSGTVVPTLTTNSWFKTLDFGTTAVNPGTTTLNVSNLILSTTGTYSSVTINFVGTGSITSNSKSLSNLTINGSGITVTMNDALNAFTVNLTLGALNLNNFTATVARFDSTLTNTRSINFGSGNIVFNGSSITALAMGTATGFTWTGTGGFVGPTTTASNSYTYAFGATGGNSTIAPNLNLSGYTGSSAQSIFTGSWFNTLNFGSTTFNPGTTTINVNNLILSSAGTYSNTTFNTAGTGTITSNGNQTVLALNINNGGGNITSLSDALTLSNGRTITLTTGTLNLNGFNLSTGFFASTGTGIRALTFGTNNITITGFSATVISMADITNFSTTGTGTFIVTTAISTTITIGSSAGGSAANAPNVAIIENLPSISSRNVTITTNSWFNTLDFSTFAQSTVTPLMSTGLGSGNFINVSTLLLSTSPIALYTSIVPAFTRTQTWTIQNSKVLGGIGVNTAGVTLTLDGTQTFGTVISNTSWLNLVSGTLNLGGFDLIIGGISSANTNTRSISFGSNNIILNHTTASTTVMLMGDATNFTWSGTGGFAASMWVSKNFQFGGSAGATAANAPNLTITEGNGIATFSGTPWFKNLNFTTSDATGFSATNIVGTLTLSPTGNYAFFIPIFTTNTTWTAPYNYLQLGGIGVNGSGVTLTLDGTQTFTTTSNITLTQGTITLTGNVSVGQFLSNNSNTRAINFGSNNIQLIQTVAAQTVLSMANATGFTYTGTGGFTVASDRTRTFNFGTTGGSITNAPNLSFTSGASVPTFTDGSWFKNLNFTGSTCTPAMTASVLGINVDTLTLASGGTYTSFIPSFTRTQTWTSQFSKQLGGIGFNLIDGTLTLDGTQTYSATSILRLTQGTITLTGTVTIQSTSTLIAGTLNLNGFTLATATFSSNNTNTRAINFGTGIILLTTGVPSSTNIDMATATNFTRSGTGGFQASSDIIRIFTFGSTAGGSATNSPNLRLVLGAAVPTFTATSWFNTLDFTGTTFTAPTASVYVNTLILAVGGTYTTFIPILTRTQTWTAQFSKQLGGLGFNLVGGTLTLDGTQPFTATSIFNLQGGTLDLGGTNLSVGSFVANSLTTQQRAILFGANFINLIHTTAATMVIDIITTVNNTFVCSGNGGFSTNMTTTRSVQCYGPSRTDVRFVKDSVPNLFVPSGGSTLSFRFLSIFNTINFTGSTTSPAILTIPSYGIYCNSVILASGGTYTSFNPIFMTSTIWTAQFGKVLSGMGICATGSGEFLRFNGAQSFTSTSTFSLEAGTLDVANSGTLGFGEFLGGYNSTFGSSTIAFGSNNINLFHTTASTQVLIVTPATNVSCTGTGGFVADASIIRNYRWGDTAGGGGGTSAGAPNLTLSGSGTSVPFFSSNSWFNKLDFGTTVFTVGVTALNLNSLTLSATGTYFNVSVTMRGTGTVILRTKYVPSFTINTSGTVTMGDAFTVAGVTTVTFTEGTWNLGSFTHLITSLNSGSSLNRRIVGPGTLLLSSSGPITITDGTNFTGSGYNINLNITSALSGWILAGNGGQYGALNLVNTSTPIGTGRLTITGSNSFENISVTSLPIIITLPAGGTQTVYAFSATGRNGGAFLSLQSSIPGTQTSISNPNQVISADYLVLKDTNATGGANWYANTNSTNNGNNTGWQFTAPPPTAPITGQGFASL